MPSACEADEGGLLRCCTSLVGGPRASPTHSFLNFVGEGLKANRPKAERSHPEVCPSRPWWLPSFKRAGQCPAPAKCGDGLQIPRRGGTLGRPFRGDLGGLSLLPVQATHTAAFSYSLRSIEITTSSAPDEYAFSSTSRLSENSLESAYQEAAAKAVCSQRIFCSSSGRRDT